MAATASSRSLPARVFAFLTSFGLAITVMFLLLVLTLLGTLAQRDLGIHAAVSKYFTSWGFVQPMTIWGTETDSAFGIPLPGGLLLMSLLFINMTCGALIKVRKDPKRFGIFIAHLSVMAMLASGLVTHLYKTDGYLDLRVGQTSNEVESYREWELEIEEIQPGETGGEGRTREALVIPMTKFDDLTGDQSRSFHGAELPFEIELSGYERNSKIIRTAPSEYAIEGVEKEKEAERNLPGIQFKVVDPADPSAPLAESFLHGTNPEPFVIEKDGRSFALRLGKKSWVIPFALTLDRFKHSYHPGTKTPDEYSSWVTQKVADEKRNIHITMNLPMRESGYVLYQESWGKLGEGPDAPVYSQFAVSKNPSDQWPKWSCIAATFGLLYHFCLKLFEYLRRQARNRKRLLERTAAA